MSCSRQLKDVDGTRNSGLPELRKNIYYPHVGYARHAMTSPAMTQIKWLVCAAAIQRSTHMAMPMPPPMQSVARPFLALRFCISNSSVVNTRAPEAPIG